MTDRHAAGSLCVTSMKSGAGVCWLSEGQHEEASCVGRNTVLAGVEDEHVVVLPSVLMEGVQALVRIKLRFCHFSVF